MKVIEFLNKFNDLEESLEVLKSDFGIKASYNEKYNLYVLNYSQVDSPKNHPIVKECRSLVIEYNSYWKVVSRAFDRFFNYGENNNTDVLGLTAYEKLDGSLISLFYHNNKWLYRTKSMIMPDINISNHNISWKELIEPLMNYNKSLINLDKTLTYIFELCAFENRVVVRYDKPKLVLLASRNNNGTYFDTGYLDFDKPKTTNFNSYEEILKIASDLPNLEEGFVLYNNSGVPIMKLKNPAYVAAHHIKGEGLTPKTIMNLIITNETDEYLSIFVEDKKYIQPYINANNDLINDIKASFEIFKNIDSQKDFAVAINTLNFKGILFQLRQGKNLNNILDNLSIKNYHNLIESYVIQ